MKSVDAMSEVISPKRKVASGEIYVHSVPAIIPAGNAVKPIAV